MNCSLFASKFTVKSVSESICVYYTSSFLKNTETSQGKGDYTVCIVPENNEHFSACEMAFMPLL